VSRAATRVNPSSKERAFAIDGYEKKTYIDPNRSIDVPLPKESPTQVVSGSAKNSITNAAALFETAAMGAKLRNTHKMGGERVKDMDHFVASVETPKVQLKIPDIAELVTEMAVEGLEDTNQVVVDETSSAMLHVQPRFRNEDGSVNPIISGHAKFFYSMVTKIVREFLRYSDPIELYYMTTIRADVSVCSLAKTNQRLYFNVLVFQQQQVYNLETGEIKEKRRIWTYWLQRAAMALASLRPNQPTGLYDKDIRSRFYQFLDSLEVDESDCEEEEL